MSDCVPFTGHIRSDGYGIIRRSRNSSSKIFMVHRWIWAEANGKDPYNLPSWVKVKHTCEINWCINPQHLTTDLDPEVLALLPAALPATQKKNTGPVLTASALTSSALTQQAKTVCTEGHAFRTEPDDTKCGSCRVNKSLDKRYEVTPA